MIKKRGITTPFIIYFDNFLFSEYLLTSIDIYPLKTSYYIKIVKKTFESKSQQKRRIIEGRIDYIKIVKKTFESKSQHMYEIYMVLIHYIKIVKKTFESKSQPGKMGLPGEENYIKIVKKTFESKSQHFGIG